MELKEIKIADPVVYWGIVLDSGDKHYGKLTKIESDPYKIGGEYVCRIKDHPGAVAINHLDAVKPGNIRNLRDYLWVLQISDPKVSHLFKKYFYSVVFEDGTVWKMWHKSFMSGGRITESSNKEENNWYMSNINFSLPVVGEKMGQHRHDGQHWYNTTRVVKRIIYEKWEIE